MTANQARHRPVDSTRVPPHNIEVEESLLGSMMLSNEAVRIGVEQLGPQDFYKPAHGTIFATIRDLWKSGKATDPVMVADALARAHLLDQVGGRAVLLRLQAGTPASANAPHYASIVADLGALRQVIEVCSAGQHQAYTCTDNETIEDIVDGLKLSLGDVRRTAGPRRFQNYAEWRLGVEMSENWLVPGVFERRDRLIIVAPEGFGKSHLLRQWAIMCACGIHWFTERRMEPMSVLIIDVENSDRQLVRNTDAMHRHAGRAAPGWNEDKFTIIPFATLDLTKRADRMAVESYLAGHRPDLLVIGPLYKILPPPSFKFSYEESAMAGIHVIDEWRARYDVAVMIEHHAPKGSGGSRNLDPLGSSAFMRWPEFGLKLEPDDDNPRVANIGRFRGDRERRDWPKYLERGGPGQWQWQAPFEERTSGEPF